ncbi:hypothetical protein [Streptomyces fagopyri]|uniref:hypothetical protein n=1 Tax=Streptomyces fagopyri TaxID=2662397 RepID=UPI0037FA6CCC
MLADGLMNANWRVEASAGVFALKRVTDVPADRLRRSLAVLAEDGIPSARPSSRQPGGSTSRRPSSEGARRRGQARMLLGDFAVRVT